jgi:hypothetical protein
MLPPDLAEIAGEAVPCRGRVALERVGIAGFPAGVVSEYFFASSRKGNYPCADVRFTVRRTIYFGEHQVN